MAVDMLSWIWMFSLGVFGTICYFVMVKVGWIKTEDDTPENPNFTWKVFVFFMFVGGILPILFVIKNPLGCFIQGLAIKPTLTYMYKGALKK